MGTNTKITYTIPKHKAKATSEAVNKPTVVGKSYRYRMYPTFSQINMLEKYFNNTRFVYNHTLKRAKIRRGKNKAHGYHSTLKNDTIKKFPWLRDIPVEALNNVIWDMFRNLKELDDLRVKANRSKKSLKLNRAYKKKRGSMPPYKKKNNGQSFRISEDVVISLDNGTVSIPMIQGEIKLAVSRKYSEKPIRINFTKSKTGKYYMLVFVDNVNNVGKKVPFNHCDVVGIDVGLSHFATMSNGEKIDRPDYLHDKHDRLDALYVKLKRKNKDSKNYNKIYDKIKLIYETRVNRRHDFLHKLSSRLVSENQAIAIETLDIMSMVRNKRFLKTQILDAAWGTFFFQLNYKSKWAGKTLVKIGQYKPSTKKCSKCGYVNNNLTLADREWVCECGIVHDRDENASVNIKKFAIKQLRQSSGRGKKL